MGQVVGEPNIEIEAVAAESLVDVSVGVHY